MDNENFSVDLKIRVNPTQDEALARLASKRVTKKATLARQAIQEYLAKEIPGYPDSVSMLAEKSVAAEDPGIYAASPRKKKPSKRKVGTVVEARSIFRDIFLGDAPAGAPCPGAFRPDAWEETVRVNVKKYPHAAFALRVRGASMTGKKIKDGDILIFTTPDKREPVAGDVVAAHIDGEVTIKTLVRKNGKVTLRAENPSYPDPVVTRNSAVQGVMIGKL